MLEELMTIKDVADFLKVKPVTVYKLVHERKLPCIKISKAWRFKKEMLEKWIDNALSYADGKEKV